MRWLFDGLNTEGELFVIQAITRPVGETGVGEFATKSHENDLIFYRWISARQYARRALGRCTANFISPNHAGGLPAKHTNDAKADRKNASRGFGVGSHC